MTLDWTFTTGLLMNGLITNSDLQGPMQGKTLEGLKSQMNNSQTFVNILTKDHLGGEIASTVKLRPPSNQTTTTTITSNRMGNLTQVQ
jgi:hypothetical protein